MQPADNYLTTQVGGAANLAELRRLKAQLDPTNLFTRCGYSFTGMTREDVGVLSFWLTTVTPSAQASLRWPLAGLDGVGGSGAVDDATMTPGAEVNVMAAANIQMSGVWCRRQHHGKCAKRVASVVSCGEMSCNIKSLRFA